MQLQPALLRELSLSRSETARTSGLTAVAFTGGDGGNLVSLADPILIVPSATTARIQEMHITLGQMLCGALERELRLV